jgi:sphingomyelin phosphodiesterase
VVRDTQDALPVGVVYIAPSVTTFWNVNPSFRVYEADAQSWELLNFEQYHMNMTRANADGAITWELFYDALSLWQIGDLSPQSWQLVRPCCECDHETD